MKKLKPDSKRRWGKMKPAQMLAHCSKAMRMAMGEVRPPRMPMGRIMGFIVKPLLLGNDERMRRNFLTIKGFEVRDHRDFEAERGHLYKLINNFTEAYSKQCTKNYHSFFGYLKPEERSILMHKHIDHCLRQFGV